MAISESKKKIVIDNYFKRECDVNTSIKEAFTKGFELGLKLAPTPKPKTGHWINVNKGKWNTIPANKCSVCGGNANLRNWSGKSPYCPWCGAKMVEEQESEDGE